MPEVEFDFQRDIVDRIARGKRYGKNHFSVLVAEGLFFDVPSNKNYKYCVDNGIANIADFAKRVEKETGVESREAILGHVQRGGAPSAKDRVIATEMGNYCVNLLKNGISNRVVVMKETDIIDLDILEAVSYTHLLGGGGHQTMAGAQIKNSTPKEALDMLKKAIDEYIEESNILGTHS